MMNTDEKKWYDKTWLVVLLVLLLPPVGLYGLWKNKGISKGIKFGVTGLLAIGLIAQLGGDSSGNEASDGDSASVEEEAGESPRVVPIGTPLETDYFDVTANKMTVADRINTGNEYIDVPPAEGVAFIIIDATFKCTDTESRTVEQGSLWVNVDGQDYEFDKDEFISDEYTFDVFETLNPLVSKTAKVVYKIPSDLKGAVYWQPSGAYGEQKISLGDLK